MTKPIVNGRQLSEKRLIPTADNVVVQFPHEMLERIRSTSTEEARIRYARLFEKVETDSVTRRPSTR